MKDLREKYIDKNNGVVRMLTKVGYNNLLPVDKARLIKQDNITSIPNEFKNKSKKQEDGSGVSDGQKSGRKVKSLSEDTTGATQA